MKSFHKWYWIYDDSVRRNEVSPNFIAHTKINPNKLNI